MLVFKLATYNHSISTPFWKVEKTICVVHNQLGQLQPFSIAFVNKMKQFPNHIR